MAYKRIIIWDLDETLIDSSHRVPNHPDGTLNLQLYFEMKNRESIFKDSLLPLMRVFRSLNRAENYVVICTARAMNQDDRDYLAHHGISADSTMCRPEDGSENHKKDADLKQYKINRLRRLKQFAGLPCFMFDDASPVIRRMRESGIVCLNAVKVNRKLAAA